MITREQKVRVGVFFFIGAFLIAALFFISFGRTLFQEKKIYFIRFEDTSVNGLEVGGNVKYNGINIGEVKSIEVSSEDIGHVIVTISVDKDTPIKEDMKANLVMMGITGLKQIELTGGTNRAEDLEPGGFIETGSSAIADITGEAQIIADKVELLLNNLNSFASSANQQAVSDILANTDYFIEQNRDKLSNVIAHTEVISSDLRSAGADIRRSAEVLREKIEGEQIDTILNNAVEVTESAQQMVDDMREVMRPERIDQITGNIAEFTEMMKGEATQQMLAETGNILTEIKGILKQTDRTSQLIDMTVLKSSRDIVDAIKTLNEALKNLNEFSRIISEDPSRLIDF
ncbi:MAG: MlaD family protein [Spirochaetia bacterium]|nr:MlaD family protein [Spirochaetia bacterium]